MGRTPLDHPRRAAALRTADAAPTADARPARPFSPRALLFALPVALALAACRPADPDALLHAGDLQGAVAAAAARGVTLDVDHPVADVLATRARSDATVTTATIADAVDAVRLLERAPIVRTQSSDLSFAKMAGFGAALDALAEGPAVFVVGRSAGLGERDPYFQNGDLPWKGGRVVGWARGDMAALGAKVDANPPAKLVTVAVRDGTGDLYFGLEHREGAWWVVTVSDAKAGARLVLAAEAVGDYGGAALRARQGGGFVRR